jgi:hypothetical protein
VPPPPLAPVAILAAGALCFAAGCLTGESAEETVECTHGCIAGLTIGRWADEWPGSRLLALAISFPSAYALEDPERDQARSIASGIGGARYALEVVEGYLLDDASAEAFEELDPTGDQVYDMFPHSRSWRTYSYL